MSDPEGVEDDGPNESDESSKGNTGDSGIDDCPWLLGDHATEGVLYLGAFIEDPNASIR